MSLDTDTKLTSLVKKARKLEKYKEGSRIFPEKYKLPYDYLIVEKYIEDNKEEVEKITAYLIKKEYWLKYNEPLLQKKIKEYILPSLFKNEITPTGTQAHLEYGYDLQVFTFMKREDMPVELREKKYEQLDSVLQSLRPEDSALIKMRFGIPPEYERAYKFVEIAEALGLNNAYLSKRLKELLVILKKPLSILFGKAEEEDIYFDEEIFNQFEGNNFHE